jgi:hypothetical protein
MCNGVEYNTMYPARESNEEERQYRITAWQERKQQRGRAFPGDPRGWEQKNPPAELTDLGKKLLGLDSWN